jgi:urea transport system ATP-binding protein
MLEVRSIDLHYGAAQVLRGVSLVAEPGKVTCVLGRNGVGKTSLLRALVGQHPVSKGAIAFDGHDITRLRPYERARRGIAYVPQGREIFPLLTVEENLKTGYAPLARSDRNIPDDVFSLFPVLNNMLGRRGGDLSGGQQQQLAIGRAMVTIWARSRWCWWSNISISRRSSATISRSWTAAPWSIPARAIPWMKSR